MRLGPLLHTYSWLYAGGEVCKRGSFSILKEVLSDLQVVKLTLEAIIEKKEGDVVVDYLMEGEYSSRGNNVEIVIYRR